MEAVIIFMVSLIAANLLVWAAKDKGGNNEVSKRR